MQLFEGQLIHYHFLNPHTYVKIEGIICLYSFKSCFNTSYRHIMIDYVDYGAYS